MYVLLVVPSNFPEGDAGAVRDLAFAKIYQQLGYNTVLIGMGDSNSQGTFNEVEYYSLYEEKRNVWDHIKLFANYKVRCIRCMESIIQKYGTPNLIHINDIPELAINYLIKYSKREKIQIIHDSTEWYSPCEFNLKRLDKAYILKNRLNKTVIRTPIKVIAISSYLQEYFEKKGIRTVRIPVIMDVKENGYIQKKEQTGIYLNLVYAGSPAQKDFLKEIIYAIKDLDRNERKRIIIHIIGINTQQLKKLFKIENLPACVKVYGRIPRKRVLALMNNMDFAFLFRPEKERYSKAGFPTKCVEAMAFGVPMICNISSDLDKYLIDGENAIIVHNLTVFSVCESLKRVLNMDYNEIKRIKQNARKTAENCFDYRKYIMDVEKLIQKDGKNNYMSGGKE